MQRGILLSQPNLHNQYNCLLSLDGIPSEKAYESGVSWNDPLWVGKSISLSADFLPLLFSDWTNPNASHRCQHSCNFVLLI